MTDAHWHRLADLVPEALALSESEREAFLDRACTAPDGTIDPDLRSEASALVAASDAADASGALVSPLSGVAAGAEAIPERIGPWRVTGVLGEGGMGIVYRAERADGLFERTVALKRIRPGLGNALVGRLEAERHTLARLEHEGIARLYDGGVSDDGVPYVVMELADGAPITDHADAAGLDAEARVALYVQVCEAVAYAHQRLVVHRDLKPSNVFVTSDGTVKLLDFGIAKLLGDDEPASFASTLTRTQAAMTPSYAAPEQIRRGEVTTATDVYALGVMLYELLAGQRPYSLAGLSPGEAERVVCETEPPPPSQVAPAERARALRGDLDTICLKALAKEPERRYASAEALAADLQRHLDGLPVLARPATVRYRVGRFVRRHRAGVAAATLAVVALAGGAGVALWQAKAARDEAAKATAVNAFLIDILGAANPDEDGRDVKVADLLDRAAASLDTAFAGQPEVEAEARRTLGATYRELGLYDEAEVQLRRALSLSERLHGPRHADVSQLQADLGILSREMGDYDAADSLFVLALATDRSLFGDESPRVSLNLTELGVTRYDSGDLDGAETMYREALRVDEAMLGPDHPDVMTDLGNLAILLADKGETDEAGRLLERELAMRRRETPPSDESIGNVLANLGSVRYDQGRGDEAARLQTEAVARFRRGLGNEHNYVGFALNNLGSTLGSLERYPESERALRESIAIYRASLGPQHPDLVFPLVNLGKTLQGAGRLDEAEATLREAVSLARAEYGMDNAVRARALIPLGQVLIEQERPAEAEPLFREALTVRRAALPPGHPDRLATASMLGDALRRMGRTGEAEPLLTRSHAALAGQADPDSARIAEAAGRLADFYDAQGRRAEAARLRSGR